jgi:phytoene synthase
MNSELSYCGQLVRAHDPDRFLLSMFSPAGSREDLWALFAFNYEIAKTREVVTETQLGLIRLQWWRDAIAGVYPPSSEDYGAMCPVVQGHEVLKALARVIARYDLPKEEFETLIYAREFDLEDVLPGNVEGLLNYAEFTSAPLMRLAVRVLGGDVNIEPVGAVAVNFALAGILRSVPFLGSSRRCLLPEDLLKRAGQRMDHLYEGKIVDGFPEIIREVADQRVEGLKPQNGFLRRADRLSRMYFKQLKKHNYNVFDPRLQLPPPFKVLRLVF